VTRSARVTINADTVKPSKAITAAATMAPLLILTGRSLLDLERELGSWDAAGRFLLKLAETVGKPIGVNAPTGPDSSRTMFLAPRSWSPERLKGWVAGHHSDVEAMFGAATLVPMEDL
jgi:hypothetical protein